MKFRDKITIFLTTYKVHLVVLFLILFVFAPTDWLYLPINVLGFCLFMIAKALVYILVLLVNGVVWVLSYVLLLLAWVVVEIIIWPINAIITTLNGFSIPPIPPEDIWYIFGTIGKGSIWAGWSGFGLPTLKNPIQTSWAITKILGDPAAQAAKINWTWITGSMKSLFQIMFGL